MIPLSIVGSSWIHFPIQAFVSGHIHSWMFRIDKANSKIVFGVDDESDQIFFGFDNYRVCKIDRGENIEIVYDRTRRVLRFRIISNAESSIMACDQPCGHES